MPKMKNKLENFKMSFNGQLSIFFDMFISYTCNLHIKLDILNTLNIIFLSNGFLNEPFALQPFPSKFQDFEIFERFDFHQVHPMNMYFHRRGHVFVVQNI
jgi:hypothetical protein